MDYVKMLTKYAIRAGVLLVVLAFVVNAIAGALPTWVAPFSVAMTLPAFLGLLIAVAIGDIVEKKVLSKYVK